MRTISIITVLLILCALTRSTFAQEKMKVTVRNASSFDTVTLLVYNENCRVVAFQGRVIRSGSIITRVCRDSRGKGNLSIIDALGKRLRFTGVRPSSTIKVRFPRADIR